MTFVPAFCCSFLPFPVRGLGASRVCSTLLWYTAGVPLAPGAHNRPAASVACQDRRCVLSWPGEIRAHTSLLAATRGPQYTPDRLIRHTVITSDVTERFPLLDPLEHGCPCRGWNLPARIRFGVRVARQRYQQRMVKGRGERIISG